MSNTRFNNVFLGLVFASGFCAFAVPPEYANLLKGRLDGLFAPVAGPVMWVAGAISWRLRGPSEGSAARLTLDDARREVERLRAQVAALTVQLEELRRLNANRELVGEARKYSVPIRVIGGEGGARESLSLQASAEDGLGAGMAVIYSSNIVGRVVSAGVAGAQVRLLTDPDCRVNGEFRRLQKTGDGKSEKFVSIKTPPPLVEGRGNGVMSITNLTMKQVQEAGLRTGDLVALRDAEDWPLLVNGYVLGKIVKIEEQSRARLFAELTVRPMVTLSQLREVMVVTGKAVTAVEKQSNRGGTETRKSGR